MVTASADKSIRIWKQGVSTHTLFGHTDAVRCLSVASCSEFVSAGDDASVRRWSISGNCLGTYYGPGKHIHQLGLLGDYGWVTSGGDPAVQVWRVNEVTQTLYMPPTVSVRSLAVLANEDIAVASSDGHVRIFSCDLTSRGRQGIFDLEMSNVTLTEQR